MYVVHIAGRLNRSWELRSILNYMRALPKRLLYRENDSKVIIVLGSISNVSLKKQKRQQNDRVLEITITPRDISALSHHKI